MAVFGLGAFHDTDDMTDDFLSNGVACIGWVPNDAPPLHKIIKHIKIGDIVYIKAHPSTHTRLNSRSRWHCCGR